MGKDILHVGVYNKNDDRLVYNMVYLDGASGISFAKRFLVTGITRDKTYDLTKGTKGTKTLYLTANPNSESEIVSIQLRDKAPARVKQFDFDFAELAIKGKGSMGNIVTKQPIKKITQKTLGDSTLGGREVFFDSVVGRLNTAGHGRYLGTFDTDNTVLVVFKDGSYELTAARPGQPLRRAQHRAAAQVRARHGALSGVRGGRKQNPLREAVQD